MHDLPDYLDLALEAAREAGRLTLGWFQTDLTPEWKADESPVTVADREAEAHIRRRIEDRYPDHTILGEEHGETIRAAGVRWIIDPIDGTRSFVAGVPLYSVLIGVEIEGDPVVGVAHFPALEETAWAAKGHGCFWNGRPARVSTRARLDEATASFTDPAAFGRHGRGSEWDRLQEATALQRGWCDAYGHLLVATGRVDLMVEPAVRVWDVAALYPILEEAGGAITDWTGRRDPRAETVVSTNGVLHDAVVSVLGSG